MRAVILCFDARAMAETVRVRHICCAAGMQTWLECTCFCERVCLHPLPNFYASVKAFEEYQQPQNQHQQHNHSYNTYNNYSNNYNTYHISHYTNLPIRYNNSGYRQYQDPNTGQWKSTHRRVAEKKIGRYVVYVCRV